MAVAVADYAFNQSLGIPGYGCCIIHPAWAHDVQLDEKSMLIENPDLTDAASGDAPFWCNGPVSYGTHTYNSVWHAKMYVKAKASITYCGSDFLTTSVADPITGEKYKLPCLQGNTVTSHVKEGKWDYHYTLSNHKVGSFYYNGHTWDAYVCFSSNASIGNYWQNQANLTWSFGNSLFAVSQDGFIHSILYRTWRLNLPSDFPNQQWFGTLSAAQTYWYATLLPALETAIQETWVNTRTSSGWQSSQAKDLRTQSREIAVRALVDTMRADPLQLLNWGHIVASGKNWNEMSYAALQDIGLWSGNGIAFLHDTASIGALATSTLNLATGFVNRIESLQRTGAIKVDRRNWTRFLMENSTDMRSFLAQCNVARSQGAKTLKEIFQTSASGYLQAHYAWRLQAMDTLEVATLLLQEQGVTYESAEQDDIQVEDNSTLGKQKFARPGAPKSVKVRHEKLYHATSSYSYAVDDTTVHQQYQITYSRWSAKNETYMQNLDEFICRCDLKLSLENLWDLVPYSFVVDWFTSVGDSLTAMDNYLTLEAHYDTVVVHRSRKISKPIKSAAGTSGPVLVGIETFVTAYGREAKHNVDTPIPDKILTTVNPFERHALEGGALLVQKVL